MSRALHRHCSLPFRPDIEGLRALSIIIVVACHAGVPYLQGGFVGVDVFFVLSGFLITGLLAEELRNTGRIQFADFYARRFRRLLPALLLMLASVLLAAHVVLAPFEQAGEAKSAVFVPLWLSNIWFGVADLDYFGARAESELFLHTWSLGVEEQFYLVWPLLLVALWRGKRLPGNSESRLGSALALIGLCSFLAGVLLTRVWPELAFYSVGSRAWQFCLGGLVYLRGESWLDRLRHLPQGASNVLVGLIGPTGLALLFLAVLLMGRGQTYPGFWALLPSIGGALLILSGFGSLVPRRATLQRALAAPFSQWLGRMSYGWYLWHWPALLLAAAVVDEPGWTLLLGIGFLALLPAAISFYLIERPVRTAPLFGHHPRTVVAASLVLMVSAAGLSHAWLGAADRQADAAEQLQFTEARDDQPVIYALGCDQWFRSDEVNPCIVGKGRFERTAVLLGDSVLMQWYEGLAEAFPAPRWKVVVLTKSACPIVHVRFFYDVLGRPYYECERWRQAVVSYLEAMRPDVVVTGSGVAYEVADEDWESGSVMMLGSLKHVTDRLILIQPTPVLRADPTLCLARRAWRSGILGPVQCDPDVNPDATRHARETNLRVKEMFEGVSVIDFSDLVCPEGQCRTHQEGVLVYRDTQHLTNSFVKQIAPKVAERVRVILQEEDIAGPELEEAGG